MELYTIMKNYNINNIQKYLLVGINAKYIHSNPAIYSLRAYAREHLQTEYEIAEIYKLGNKEDKIENKIKNKIENKIEDRKIEIELAEFTINQQISEIRKEIYLRKPYWIGFSCYIWNIEIVKELIPELHKLMPDVPIWLGGPEVSYHEDEVMQNLPEIAGIISGEGEKTFTELIEYYHALNNDILEVEDEQKNNREFNQKINAISGIVYRKGEEIISTPRRNPIAMSELPFPYKDMKDFENRIVYYETSRGCPFSCAYCLSSVDKKLRYRDMKLVEEELQFFIDAKVPQVKFIDRTFNCDHKHSLAILHYIEEHDNGITNFHFEIAADILTEEEIEILKSLRPGLVQLEIGVQSTNEDTLKLVCRHTNLKKVKENSQRLLQNRNIHLHLDLIAGLPGEGMESFIKSFNDVYSMGSDELQLGFLKLLKGSPMELLTREYGIVTENRPPYEVLYTKDLSFENVLKLKEVEEMLELYHNSQQFVYTEKQLFPDYIETMSDLKCEIDFINREKMQPFDFYMQLANYYKKKQEQVINSNRTKRYEILLEYLFSKLKNTEENVQDESIQDKNVRYRNEQDKNTEKALAIKEILTVDYYQRENAKARPAFALNIDEYKNAIYDFYKNEVNEKAYLKDYEGYDWKQLMRMTHIEVLKYARIGESDESFNALLFDYHHRSPVTGGVKMIPIKLELK